MITEPYTCHDPDVDEAGPQHRVKLDMARAEAVALFHALARTLEMFDGYQAEAPRWLPSMDDADQASYDATASFVNQLQRDLQIELDPG
jgi:hypothetical protein